MSSSTEQHHYQSIIYYPYHFRVSHQGSYTHSNSLFAEAAHQPWTENEMASRRRRVQIHRFCSEAATTTTPFETETIIISCIVWELPEANQYIVTSPDLVKLVQFLFQVQLGDIEKKIYRRNLDGLKNFATIEKPGALFQLIAGLADPEPVPTLRSFKVFPWACIDTAIDIFLQKDSIPKEPQRLTLPEWVSYNLVADVPPTASTPESSSLNVSHASPSTSTQHLTTYHNTAELDTLPSFSEALTSIPIHDYSLRSSNLLVHEQVLHSTPAGVHFHHIFEGNGQEDSLIVSRDILHSSWIDLQRTTGEASPIKHAVLPSNSVEDQPIFPANLRLVHSQGDSEPFSPPESSYYSSLDQKL